MSRVVLLGTGPSTGVPYLRCLMDKTSKCEVCPDAVGNPESKNWRGNVCMLIQYQPDISQPPKNILIDCGKTFRQSVQRFFTKLGITGIDALLLTHEHADAVLGMDDLRDVQQYEHIVDPVTQVETVQVSGSLPVYLSAYTLDRMKCVFPYLVPNHVAVDPNIAVPRYVAKLDCHVFDDENVKRMPDKIDIHGFEITPVRVLHGGDYISYGFLFGPPSARFVYLSDISGLVPETEEILLQTRIDILVLDSVFMTRIHATHFSLPQALDFIRRFRPRKSYLVGMTHEFDYRKHNDEIRAQMALDGLDVEMAYDGMVLEFVTE